MKRSQSQNLYLSIGVVALGVFALGIFASAGTSSAMSHEDAPDAEALWEHIQEANYESWEPFPNAPEGFYEGTRPHGAQLRTFGNESAVANPQAPPPGSIVVKENYTPNKELVAVTVMKKVEGYDAENQDWFWVKYDPDGSVAEQEGMKLAGKVKSCIGCHASAVGDDYLYTNDAED
ncbi:MAG: cytochrome P460 family protein [Thermoanaerobaculia bacterium]|nr:cytochrome P460 family protein [Thermoanaerobaculia bacterium]